MAVDVEHPNPTLAPCPFCGSSARLYQSLSAWKVQCEAADEACGQCSTLYATPEIAAERWNRRAPIIVQRVNPNYNDEAITERLHRKASMWTEAGLDRLQAALDDPQAEARVLKDDGAPDPVDDAEREGYLREAQLQGYRAEFFVETINHLIDLAALERLKVYDVHRERHLAQAREACAASKVDADAPPKSPT